MIFSIATEHLNAYWPHAVPHLSRVPGFDEAFERKLVEAQDRQLWLMVDDGKVLAAVTTEVSEEPEKVISVMNGGGVDMDRWLDAFEGRLDEWAKAIGATRLRVVGRRGWVRRLPHFKEVGTIVEKRYG